MRPNIRGPPPSTDRDVLVRLAQNRVWNTICMLVPLAMLVLIWSFALSPQWYEERVWSVPFLGSRGDAETEEESITYPSDILEAFDLGSVVHEVLMESESGADPTRLASLLNATATALNVNSITVEEIRSLRAMIVERIHKEFTIRRVLGFLNFVNIMWLLAILGISISLVPAFKILARPLRKLLSLSQLLFEALRRVLEIIAMNIARVIVLTGDILAYGISFVVIVEATRHSSFAAPIVALSGALIAFFTLSASLMYRYPHSLFYSPSEQAMRTCEDDNLLFARVTSVLNFFFLIPLAVCFQSTLLGFLAMVSFYSAFGFVVGVGPLMYVVGFSSPHSVEVCTGISAAVTCITAALHKYAPAAFEVPDVSIFSNSPTYDIDGAESLLAPFSLGLTVFGPVVLGLGLLILSSSFREDRHYIWQTVTWLSLICMTYVGYTVPIGGFVGVGCTMLVLHVSQVILALSHDFGAMWVGVLTVSVGTYLLAIQLYDHPEWL